MRRRPTALTIAVVLAAEVCGSCATDAAGSGATITTTPSTSNIATIDPGSPATAAAPTTTQIASTARLGATLVADEFAAMLSTAHTVIIDPTSPAELVAQNGRQLQLLLRALADQPTLDDTVLAALDPAARPTIERIVRARQFLQARRAADTTPSEPPSEPPSELPAWTIAEPESIDTLLAHYTEAESLTGVPWYWLAAIHLQETRMGRIQGVSAAGAVGPMQFLPTTWAECCTGDPLVTRDAIIGAATYLAQSGGPADMNAAVYQYNPNDGYVAVVTAYAEALRDEPALYRGFHAFQVFVSSAAGTVRLPVGYSQTIPIDATIYLAANPADAA